MRSFSLFIASLVLLASPSTALAWGAIGHRATGAIAQDDLSGVARAHIKQILGNETLAEASTWPDEQRSNPAEFWQKAASPWHYVTVPAGSTYTANMALPEGDAVTALSRFAAALRNPNASLEDRGPAGSRWWAGSDGTRFVPAGPG
ncbi:MAG TPA: S1/P1 nuclease [Novosphingobium sp.]